MFRKAVLTLIAGVALSAAAKADVFVRVGPPRPPYERRMLAPGPGYVWTPGYYRWAGARYVWVPGVWVMAPRPHARGVPAHWARRPGGWVFIEGHWRR